MKKSIKFFAKITCTLLALCLTTTGCAYGQQGKTPPSTEASEVIAVETVSDPMPVSIALGNDWCYLRFNLTRERLEDLAEEANNIITLSLPSLTPNGNAFSIDITSEDVEQSLQLLDKHPEQQSVNLIKEISTDALTTLDKPDRNLHYVYYLLTEDDVTRMLDYLQTVGADTVLLRQRLDINDDRVAELHLDGLALIKCLEILHNTDQDYVVYICPVEVPEFI